MAKRRARALAFFGRQIQTGDAAAIPFARARQMLRRLNQRCHQPGGLGAGSLIRTVGGQHMRPHGGLRRRLVAGDRREQRLVGTAPAIEHGIDKGVFAAETILHPPLEIPIALATASMVKPAAPGWRRSLRRCPKPCRDRCCVDVPLRNPSFQYERMDIYYHQYTTRHRRWVTNGASAPPTLTGYELCTPRTAG